MWGYRAHDGLATGVFGLWGSFWASYGLLYALFGAEVLTQPIGPFSELAIWFMVLSWITIIAAWAAGSVSWLLVGVFALVVPGSALAAAGLFSAITA